MPKGAEIFSYDDPEYIEKQRKAKLGKKNPNYKHGKYTEENIKLNGKKKKWSDEEVAILKEKYPDNGSDIPELKNRTKDAILSKANRLGIETDLTKLLGYERWNKKKVKKSLLGITKSIGHDPSYSEIVEEGGHNLIHACRRYFGSFSEAKEAIGLGIYRENWTEKEMEVLREEYPDSGKEEILSQLDGRTWKAIKEKANKNDVNRKKERIRKETVKSLMDKPTKPEKKIIGLTKKYNLPFEYVGDGEVIIGELNPDFINNEEKEIIEVFGDYWHKEVNSSWKRTEFGRKAYFSQLGYNCLVLWEHQINKKSDEKIRNEILTFHRGDDDGKRKRI